MTLVSSFDFELPPDLIAQEPRARGTVAPARGRSRRARVEGSVDSRSAVAARARRSRGGQRHPGVPGATPRPARPERRRRRMPAPRTGRPARPATVKKSGGRSSIRVRSSSPGHGWSSTILSVRRASRSIAEILEQRFFGRRRLTLQPIGTPSVADAIDALGHVPLPPYIHRPDRAEDRERYQTVYAREPGAVAAPTAGLHFDDALVARLAAAGIGWATLTLHVGYGTFKPVRVDRVEDHHVDPERFVVSPATAHAINRVRRRRRPHRGRGHDDDPDARERGGRGRPRRAARRHDRPVHSPRLPLSRRRRASDELPPAQVVAA